MKVLFGDTVRKVYDLLALLALLHMAALVGLGAYLFGTGTVDLKKLRDVAMIVRGENPFEQDQTDGAAPAEEESTKPRPGDAMAALERMEVLRLDAERIKAELDQRLALNNSIMLRVKAERSAFESQREEAAREDRAALEAAQAEGFRKQLAIYEGLAPKIAVQHLLSLGDAEEAARVLLEMNTRKARKIVEAAKRGEQLIKMQRILEKVREAAPDRSADFEEGGG